MKNTGLKTNATEQTEVKKPSGSNALRIVLALLLTGIILVVLVGETLACAVTVIPGISIWIFQYTGISVASGLTFSEFAVGDVVVLCMVWLLPSLFVVVLMAVLQNAIWKLGFRFVGRFWRKALRAFKKRKEQ